jgi:hypothetical protein
MNRIIRGTIAGAVGIVALDVATHLDMAVRGRPPSALPAKAADELGEGEQAGNRASGLGALLGYLTGLVVACVYALVAPRAGKRTAADGLALGAIAMVAADAPMVALGLTKPRSWDVPDWLSDAIPYLAYGMAVALTVDALRGEQAPASRWSRLSARAKFPVLPDRSQLPSLPNLHAPHVPSLSSLASIPRVHAPNLPALAKLHMPNLPSFPAVGR